MRVYESGPNYDRSSRLNAATDLASLLLQTDSDKALEVLIANENVTSPRYWRTRFSVHEMRNEIDAAINSLRSGYELGDNRCCTYLIKLIEMFPNAKIANDALFMEKLMWDANKLYESRNPELIWALAKLAQLRSDNEVFLGNLLSLQLSIDEEHPAQSGGASLMINFIYDRMSHYLGEDLSSFLREATNESNISTMAIQIQEMFNKLDDEITSAWKVSVPSWDKESGGCTLIFIVSTFMYFQREFNENKLDSVHALPTFNLLLELANSYHEVPKPMTGFSMNVIREKSTESLKSGDLILYLEASNQPEQYGLTYDDIEMFEKDLESWGLMPYMHLIRFG